ncbi:hypothetical protein FFWV33_09320 [Flavobacterium faecale]|uniref:YdhG-like domain-containing protein n=1 Tax=Flavobacterium faecale TaxID=1355330 RepID=A0A2S1LDB3_9FLAO|nr:DUF1801 domain-containing protein [Flavobacterium faecale]AWG21724.1 hypothetical protein FFWV33_09320 [Flavobacterium faecale]
MNPKVDDFLSKAINWQNEMQLLRKMLLECQLDEDLKWRQPCYSYNNTNVIIIGGFKEHCTLSFFKGVLLQDPEDLLEAPGENSQSMRVIKFKSEEEIVNNRAILKSYIYQAIEIEKAGLKVVVTKDVDLEYPEELKLHFAQNPTVQLAFESLTPGRQRGYHLFFTAAKQSQTRTARIEKYSQQILSGKGINDCTCGLSKKGTICDGSHKLL